jgi:hypothetical protein
MTNRRGPRSAASASLQVVSEERALWRAIVEAFGRTWFWGAESLLENYVRVAVEGRRLEATLTEGPPNTKRYLVLVKLELGRRRRSSVSAVAALDN